MLIAKSKAGKSGCSASPVEVYGVCMQSCNMPMLKALAPAKINLYLHIVGRRSDRYHLLDSWVAFADVGDELQVSPSSGLSLECTGEYASLIPVKENSVLGAAQALAKHYGINDGAHFTLHKHLPVAAGIGGGTADAAAALRLLVQLWQLKPTAQEMKNIALSLGADVPACLRAESLFMNGIGEVITPAQVIDHWHGVLVNPRVALSTPAVFAVYDGHLSPAMPHKATFPGQQEAFEYLKQAHNDLQVAATALVPEIQEVIDALAAQEGCAFSRMSGSGATCFALFDTEAHAQAAARRLASSQPSWWVRKAILK